MELNENLKKKSNMKSKLGTNTAILSSGFSSLFFKLCTLKPAHTKKEKEKKRANELPNLFKQEPPKAS